MSEVLVRGRAEGHVTPDVAVLSVTVLGRDPATADASAAAAAEVGDRVDAVLGDRRVGDDPVVRRVRVSSVRVSEIWEHQQGRRHRTGFQAERRSEVECRADGPGLTDLMGSLVAVGAQLGGPAWRIAPGNAGWAELRAGAVADARARAEHYANAAGGRVGAIRWLAEPGMRGSGVPEPRMGMARMMSAESGVEGEPRMARIEVEDIPVSVEVEIAYDLV